MGLLKNERMCMWVCVIVCVGVLVLMHVSVSVCLMWMGVQGANVHCGKKATRRNTGSMGSQGTSDTLRVLFTSLLL